MRDSARQNLRENIKAKLNAGHALDETDRHKPHNRNKHSNNESPPVHQRWVTQANTHGYRKHDNEQGGVPPLRGVFIFLHHPEVDIFLLTLH